GTDLAGNVVSSAPTSGATFTIENTPPTAAITYAPSGAVKAGTTLTLTATFSEAMADAPAPQFAVSGANTVAAAPMTKIDATHYTGSYIVGAGSGTATDTAGNTAPAAGPSTPFTVDNSSSTITSVSPPADGSYRAGQNLNFTVTFSENVTVVTTGGTPAMGLTIGAATRNATYVSG